MCLRGQVGGVVVMLKFLAGMIFGGVLAMYPALAYPQQLHSVAMKIGLASLLPGAVEPKK